MKNFIKAFFAGDESTVDSKVVIGFVFLIATLCAGFIPGVGTFAFWGFLASTLGAFTIKVPEALAKIKSS